MKSWKAESMLLLMTLIWGATFLFTKMGLEYTGTFFYLIMRFGLAITLLLLVFGKRIKNISKDFAKKGLFLGFLFGIGFILQTKGLVYTSIQKSAFITGLTVVLTPFTFWLVERKKVLFFSKIGVIVATIGLYLFTDPDLNNINLGDILTLLSTFCWAFFITFIDKFTSGDDNFDNTIKLVYLQMIGTIIIVFLGFMIFELQEFKVQLHSDLLYSVLFNGAIASFILMIVHTNFQKYTTPVKAALIFSMEPVFAALFAFIFLSEVLNEQEQIGAIILMLGVLTSELGMPILKLLKIKKD